MRWEVGLWSRPPVHGLYLLSNLYDKAQMLGFPCEMGKDLGLYDLGGSKTGVGGWAYAPGDFPDALKVHPSSSGLLLSQSSIKSWRALRSFIVMFSITELSWTGNWLSLWPLSYRTLYMSCLAQKCRSFTNSNWSASCFRQKVRPSRKTVDLSSDNGYEDRLIIS